MLWKREKIQLTDREIFKELEFREFRVKMCSCCVLLESSYHPFGRSPLTPNLSVPPSFIMLGLLGQGRYMSSRVHGPWMVAITATYMMNWGCA